MSGIRPLISLLLISLALPALAQTPASTASKPAATANSTNVLVERVGDTGFIQLQAESFKQLDPETAGARLLADAGVHRDRPDHLRPAVALRHPPEAAARRDRRPSRRASIRRR